MKDKILLEIIEEYMLDNDKKRLEHYLNKYNKTITRKDLFMTCLCLLKKDTLFYVADCNRFKDIINNIDNEEWLNNEDNYN